MSETPAAPAPTPVDEAAVKKEVFLPALFLAILAGVLLLVFAGDLVLFAAGAFRNSFRTGGVNYWKLMRYVFPLVCLLAMGLNALVLFGSIQMMRLRNRGVAMAAAIVAIIPISSSVCCLLTAPVGIWALVVLSRPHIKAAFH